MAAAAAGDNISQAPSEAAVLTPVAADFVKACLFQNKQNKPHARWARKETQTLCVLFESARVRVDTWNFENMAVLTI